MRALLFGLAAAALAMCSPAHAGVAFGDIPSKGSVPYYKQPDGTYAPAPADAGGTPLANPQATPLGFQQVAVSSSAVGFTPPTGAKWCLFAVESNAVRWRDDGTNPTASVGFPADSGERIAYSGTLTAIKFIRQSADATLDVACFK